MRDTTMSQGGDPDTSAVYEELRPLMFSIAYRMLGSATEAEDLVQEAYLRFHRATSQGEVIESPKAYLATVTTRLAIDALRSARARANGGEREAGAVMARRQQPQRRTVRREEMKVSLCR